MSQQNVLLDYYHAQHLSRLHDSVTKYKKYAKSLSSSCDTLRKEILEIYQDFVEASVFETNAKISKTNLQTLLQNIENPRNICDEYSSDPVCPISTNDDSNVNSVQSVDNMSATTENTNVCRMVAIKRLSLQCLHLSNLINYKRKLNALLKDVKQNVVKHFGVLIILKNEYTTLEPLTVAKNKQRKAQTRLDTIIRDCATRLLFVKHTKLCHIINEACKHKLDDDNAQLCNSYQKLCGALQQANEQVEMLLKYLAHHRVLITLFQKLSRLQI